MHHTNRIRFAALLIAAIICRTSNAQTTSPSTDATTATTTTTASPAALSQSAPAAPTSSANTEAALQMGEFNVTDVPLEQQILPTARPFTSVFGTEDNIMEVPRNVTIISREQMDTIDIQDVTEFSKLTSSSYTDSNFGSPSNPTIRGQSADVFMNGMRQRIGESGDGMPLDFNFVESVNIVPGPATAVQGATAYVGGFVDLISKQPFFDGFKGVMSYTIGSYDTNRWNLDVGGPISSTLAYRFSYSGEDSDGWWDNWIKETTSIYGAITWRPNQTYELFLDTKAFWADYRENYGINRATQALISNGLYTPGTNVNDGTTAGPGNLQNALNVDTSSTVDYGTPVPVNYHETAQGPASHAHGQEYNAQAIQTLKISSSLNIVDNTMFSYTKRDTFNSFGFSEIIDPTWFIDNRTEVILMLPKVTVNTGLEERFQSVNAFDDFFFEPVNVWDLSSTTLRSDINAYLALADKGGFGGVPVPGWPGRYATRGIINDDTNASEAAVISPFIQTTWNINKSFNLVSGARLDVMHVESTDPFTPNTGANIGVAEPNANVSLVYKVDPAVSSYITYNYSQNYTGDLADGGGFGLYTDPNTGKPTLPRSLFAEESQLFEYGWKFSTLKDRLFVSTDIFAQNRQNKPQDAPVIQYQYYGFEVSANYQPNKNFFATLGYSWINGSTAAPVPFQSYDTNQIPGGPPDPNTNPGAYQTTGRLRASGQPLDTFNALAQYTLDSGFGAEANVLVTSPMNDDFQGYLVIPWQYSVDASVFYKTKRWVFKVQVKNLTNQHNWTPSDPTDALASVVPDPGIEVFGTVKYKF
jgi:catecholate siderophore receptor